MYDYGQQGEWGRGQVTWWRSGGCTVTSEGAELSIVIDSQSPVGSFSSASAARDRCVLGLEYFHKQRSQLATGSGPAQIRIFQRSPPFPRIVPRLHSMPKQWPRADAAVSPRSVRSWRRSPTLPVQDRGHHPEESNTFSAHPTWIQNCSARQVNRETALPL